MAPKTTTTDEKLTEALYLRASATDIDRLDALVEQIQVGSRNAIARIAMRLGLELLEEDPSRILKQPMPKRGRKKGSRKS